MASISTQKASCSSSSSNSTQQWKYNVFLSFRGEDNRNSFTDHLYAALKQKGILTFRDEEKLERGKSISLELMQAIEESRFAIVILSKNYASSTWCLDELAKLIGSMKEKGTTVFPVFYDLDPSTVRKQTGTFAEAFAKHEEHFKDNIEKVQTWRIALREVADLKGWHLQNRPESEIIQNIVGQLWHKLSDTFEEDFEGLVGIISRAEKLESCLAIGLNDVRFIGIWGMGGIGKTTLARVVFHKVSVKFEGRCFLSNVREVSEKDGLVRLQQKLIFRLLNEEMSIQDVEDGVFVIKNRLRHKRILLILDDVNKLDQLKKLVGKHIWFGSGSRVIVTTRDKHLLQTLEVDEIYEVDGLNGDQALHLLSLKAFEKDHPPEDYLEMSEDFVHYANGLPLAIEILGSFLLGRNINEWKSTLNRLKEFPELEILQVLKISFDGLREIEKEIFLHIACFFNHDEEDDVVEILDYLGLYPDIGLRVLMDKSLIKINDKRLWMHDLLQEMAKSMVRQDCPEESGKHSRLWLFKDINNVLSNDTGTKAIQGIVLKFHELEEAYWNPESFTKMQSLKLLIMGSFHFLHDLKHLPNGLRVLSWSGYPSKSFPTSFPTKGLSPHPHIRYDFIVSGSDIPEWFSHQSLGAELNIKEPYSHLCNELMGIVVCAVFCSQERHPHHQIDNDNDLSNPLYQSHSRLEFRLTTNGVTQGVATDIRERKNEDEEENKWLLQQTLSSNLWLLYLSSHFCRYWGCDANGFSQIGIEIKGHGFKVKKCGLRMVYKKDIKGLNRTTAQCSNNSITPYEGLDVLHPNFNNSAVLAEVNEVKRSRDDYDGAGPSGEGSSNDVPHPKRIQRLTESMTHGNSNCEDSSDST